MSKKKTPIIIVSSRENDRDHHRDLWLSHWKETDINTERDIEPHAIIIHSKPPKGKGEIGKKTGTRKRPDCVIDSLYCFHFPCTHFFLQPLFLDLKCEGKKLQE